HYSTISARYLDIITRHPSWSETGKLIETLRFPASSMTAPGYYQVTVMVPSWILESHAQKIGRNYGIKGNQIGAKKSRNGKKREVSRLKRGWYLDYNV
ncbi:2887_t:CDS:2, partial [Acaulospora morrowiae]